MERTGYLEGVETMLGKNWLWLLGVVVLGAAGAGRADAQVIGSYSNFDCFNDHRRAAEGFEIDIEDVWPSDITRIFPDNFSPGQPYISYATPDRNALQLVTFPDGHTGVRILYAASYVGGQWVAQWGSSVMPGTTTPLGNATPFVSHPTYTTGDSCWTLGRPNRVSVERLRPFRVQPRAQRRAGQDYVSLAYSRSQQSGQPDSVRERTVAAAFADPVPEPSGPRANRRRSTPRRTRRSRPRTSRCGVTPFG